MEVTTLHGNGYNRLVNTDLLQSSSPIFKDLIIDVSTSGLSNKILDYIFDLVEDKVDIFLTYDEYLIVVKALDTFQMKELLIDVLEDFTDLISNFKTHEFASIVYLLLDYNINPNLTKDDLEYLPIENPFEKYIIDLSKKTYLDYSYFDTVGEVSRYSSLMPWHLQNVKRVMLQEIKNPNQITDLTAHIGVDSVNFSILYPNTKIISIEFDYNVYLLLRDNLLRYCITLNKSPFNLRAYNNDATQILDYPIVINSDVIYIDPPWKESIKINNTIRLRLGDMNIEEIIRKLSQVKTIILKGPVNLYTNDLYKLGARIKRYEIYTKPQGGNLSYLLFFIRF
jgi:hypothetical protein